MPPPKNKYADYFQSAVRVIFRIGGLTFFRTCLTILIYEGDVALGITFSRIRLLAQSLAASPRLVIGGGAFFYLLHYIKYSPTNQGDNQLFAIFSFRIAPKRQGTPSSVPFLISLSKVGRLIFNSLASCALLTSRRMYRL